MKKYFLFSIIIFILVSFSDKTDEKCSDSKVSNLRVIKVLKKDIKEDKTWSDFFSVREIIPLETSEKFLINNINQIEICDEKIFVVDKKSTKLFIFNSNGQFLRQIGRRGKGPGEFLRMGSFAVNQDQDLIYITNSLYCINVFNYEGKFIKTLGTKINPVAVGISNDNNIAISTLQSGGTVQLFNPSGQKIREFLPFEAEFFRVLRLNYFFPFDDNLFHWNDLNDTIYTIRNGLCYPHTYIDLEYKISRKKYINERVKPKGSNYVAPGKYMWNVDYYTESDKYISFGFYYQYAFHTAISNKKSGEVAVLKMDNEEDIFYSNKIYLMNVFDSGFVGILNPSNLPDYSSQEKKDNAYHNLSKESISILKNIKAEDNPIVVILDINRAIFDSK